MNLRPVSAGAGQLPLFVHVDPNSTDPGALKTGGPVLLDWFLENASPFPTARDFVTDLFVDGIHVERWRSTQSPPFQKFGIRNWSGLNDQIRLGRGDHTFRLVVDALDQISETDETDNVFEWTYTWGGDPLPVPESLARAVNLVPANPRNLSAPLVAAPVPGAYQSGLLSVLSPVFVSWGAQNIGLASTDADIAIHLYFDGMLVQSVSVSGLAASSKSVTKDWADLSSLVGIEPGRHTLRLVVDPGNLVAESDETDNEFIAEFEWLAGTTIAPPLKPAPTPIPAPPFEELTQPNLTPHKPFGWDSAITVKPLSSATDNNRGLDLPVSSGSAVQVEYVVKNSSPVATTSGFDVTLLLDGQAIDVARFPRMGSGESSIGSYVIPTSSVSPGPHRLSLIVDSGSELAEADENDNEFERLVVFASGDPPGTPTPTAYSITSLREFLAALPELLLETRDVDGPERSSRDWLADISKIADAGYFLATGTAIRDERLSIEFLPRSEYLIQLVEACMGDTGPMTAIEHAAELATCRMSADQSIGVRTQRDGRILVLIDTTNTPAQVLSTLFHELGHARQRLLAPGDGSVSNSALSALREAQAQVFEAVGWRSIEEFLDISVTSYPDLSVLNENVRDLLAGKLDGANDEEEHDLGYVLMWLTALQDPGGLGIAGELRTIGKLSPASTLAFYDYLLTIEPDEAEAWAAQRLANSSALLVEFQAITLGRLVAGLASDTEGHPDLREVAFLAP